MRTQAIRILAGAVVAVVALASPARAHHRPNNEVLIGGAISQTGQYAEPAGRQVNSIKLWVDEVNARGGLLGHPCFGLLGGLGGRLASDCQHGRSQKPHKPARAVHTASPWM